MRHAFSPVALSLRSATRWYWLVVPVDELALGVGVRLTVIGKARGERALQ